MIICTVFHNDEPIKTYEINRSVINIGRLPENDIPIASISISRRHVRIEQDATGAFVLQDLNSLNGTFVNNKKVKEVRLADGDKITIGKYMLLFELSNEESDVVNLSSITPSAPQQQMQSDAQSEEELMEEATAIPQAESSAVLIETNKHVVYKIDKPSLTIGSSEKDDIFVEGFLITDGHALIETTDDGIWIHANKLMGKFKINGKKVSKHQLQHKDRIEIGTSTFRFMENGQH